MGKMPDEQVTKNWESLLAAVLKTSEQAHGFLVKCKPDVCNKRIVAIYNNLAGFEQRIAANAIKMASRPIFGQALQVKWRPFSKQGKDKDKPVITEEMPTPDPVQCGEALTAEEDDYPLFAKILSHYPNNKLVLTSVGVAKCVYARKFRLGMEVPVFKEGDWLVIRGLPKTPHRYR